MTLEWLAALVVGLILKTAVGWLVWSHKKVREDMAAIVTKQHDLEKDVELSKQMIKNLSDVVKEDIKEIKDLLKNITKVTVRRDG
jgi:hypothetical protein